jgi:enoyl-CoA hydratase/carnithine racemase
MLGGFESMSNEREDNIIRYLEADRRCYRITIDRARKLNALTPWMYREIRAGILAAEGDTRVDAVVIDASPGRAFATGGDLASFLQSTQETEDLYRNFDDQWRTPFDIMLRTTKPILAVVDGLCYAGGLIACLCSDIVIATERSAFAIPESRVGLAEAFTVTLLPLVVGLTRARHMAFTGAPIDAATAERWGIVTTLVGDSDMIESKVDEILAQIRSCSPDAIALYKTGMAMAIPPADPLTVMRIARATNGTEGLRAFVERRDANWER